MALFGSRPSSGSWFYTSKSDKRWSCSGDSDCLAGCREPDEATTALERKKKELGKQPDDLEFGYVKH